KITFLRYFYQKENNRWVRIFICLLFLLLGNFVFAQNSYLNLSSLSEKEKQIIDSLSYHKIHANPKSITDEIHICSERLTKIGYLQNRALSPEKNNDSTFTTVFSLGQKVGFVHISTHQTPYLKEIGIIENDSIMIPFSDIESFMNVIMQKLETRGYSMSKVMLKNFLFDKNILKADLVEQISTQRQLNDIVVLGYEKFPEGHKRQL